MPESCGTSPFCSSCLLRCSQRGEWRNRRRRGKRTRRCRRPTCHRPACAASGWTTFRPPDSPLRPVARPRSATSRLTRAWSFLAGRAMRESRRHWHRAGRRPIQRRRSRRREAQRGPEGASAGKRTTARFVVRVFRIGAFTRLPRTGVSGPTNGTRSVRSPRVVDATATGPCLAFRTVSS